MVIFGVVIFSVVIFAVVAAVDDTAGVVIPVEVEPVEVVKTVDPEEPPEELEDPPEAGSDRN